MTTETYDFDDFILGPDKPISTIGTMLSGKNVPRLTPVMIDSTDGYFLPWNGTPGTAVGLTAMAVDSTAGNTSFSYYKTGSFRYSSVAWDSVTGTPTDTKKQAAFAGSAISTG